MIRTTLAATLGTIAATLVASTAYAAPQLERVRGTVESATPTTVTVKTADGKTKTLTVAPATKFVNVVKSTLDEVKDGKFIGTATKGEPPVALEVVVFPASMNGTAEGHYGWDDITDTTRGGAPVKSSMTNGTIKATSPGGLTKSSMTNGTIKGNTMAGGDKTITVTYDNGQSLNVKVPASAPIVAFEPADAAIVKPGTTLFSVATVEGDKLNARLVAIGKDGVKPPM